MKKFLPLSLPLGLIIFVVYTVVKHFVAEIPDSLAYPIMIISETLMIIGIAYNGYCIGKKKNPFTFK